MSCALYSDDVLVSSMRRPQDCVARCDISDRPTLYNNVIVSGGTTCFPGFDDRLQQELRVPAWSLGLRSQPDSGC